ncbi:bacteriocin resistance YdeI/OmpD-like protein [Maribacter vaceletii]|uniref:Bacteriocin resistance YdeI/OmpD-like protein n=1 Tax=Maribacter vaceletii TaxID=1206816 RepID=A0A495ECG4_9FLAO|nr:YdeI/OmpD-associated family protein [Maribacter vaceletii]RKR14253.1 bacteriocin resistance YdeI/OmpD-like protein [Maribacter vaceletii]
MQDEKPLVNKEYLLQKFHGKGGWTYAEIPEVLQNKNNPFGWVKVKGSIDSYSLKQYKLMPMGNSKLFLPVKAEIRKKIKKQAGDYVHVVLYADTSSLEIPAEILECFKNEPKQVFKNFTSFTQGEQKTYVDWIYQAKTEETKANRIAQMLKKVEKKMRFSDKEDSI